MRSLTKAKLKMVSSLMGITLYYLFLHYKIEDSLTFFTDNPQPLQPRTPEEIKEIKERLRGKKQNENTIESK